MGQDVSSTIRIRPLEVEDAEPLAALHLAVWRAAYGGLVPPEGFATVDLADRAARWRATARGEGVPPRRALVAVEGDRLVGFVAYGDGRDAVPGVTGEVLALYVDEPLWGSDVGHRLLRAARAELAAEGHERFYLWVLRDNPRARRFYERAGLRTDGAEVGVDLFGTMLAEVRYTAPVAFAADPERAHSTT